MILADLSGQFALAKCRLLPAIPANVDSLCHVAHHKRATKKLLACGQYNTHHRAMQIALDAFSTEPMPWRIPEADIERVKRETDWLALVRSRGVELKKHGAKDFIGRCPFHSDQDTPNFIVSPDKGLCHCMACGKAGNVIQFVQAHDGLSFRHAFEVLRRAARRAFAAQPVDQAKHRAATALPAGRRGGRRGAVRPGGRLLPPALEVKRPHGPRPIWRAGAWTTTN